MPKINVYLPDELAASVRAAGVPVSAVCQRALSEAVERIGTARRAIEAMRSPDFDPARVPQLGARLAERMTPRLQDALRLGKDVAGSRHLIETKDLLLGMLEEGGNLALGVLEVLNVDRDALREAARAAEPDEPANADQPPADDEAASGETDSIPALIAELGSSARAALASALESAIELGHNYVGTEHLLVGLARTANSGAGRLLGAFGIDASSASRAVGAAIAGYAQARQQSAANATTRRQLDAVLARLEALEARLAASGS